MRKEIQIANIGGFTVEGEERGQLGVEGKSRQILNEREGGQKREKERVRKILPSLKCLVIGAGMSSLLVENQPFKQPDSFYCLCFQFIPPLSHLCLHITNATVCRLRDAGGIGKRKKGKGTNAWRQK